MSVSLSVSYPNGHSPLTQSIGKGFSIEFDYIHNVRYELDNNLLSQVLRGLQADWRRFERTFKGI